MSPLAFYGFGLLVLAGNVFAVWKGGVGERLAGGLNLSIILIEEVLQATHHLPIRFELLDLLLAAVTAVGYVAIAVRSGSVFLGLAMLCQAAELYTVAEILNQDELSVRLSAFTNYETLLVTAFVDASVAWALFFGPSTFRVPKAPIASQQPYPADRESALLSRFTRRGGRATVRP